LKRIALTLATGITLLGGSREAYAVVSLPRVLFNFIHNPANNVYFESYFDVSAGDGDHRFVDEPGKKDPAILHPTKLPVAAAKYLELFTLPAGAQAPVGPAPALASAAGAPAPQ